MRAEVVQLGLATLTSLACAYLLFRYFEHNYDAALTSYVRSPVGAAVLINENRILLTVLKKGPFEGVWSLPAAYLHRTRGDRSTLDTAKRKVMELSEDVEITSCIELTRPGGTLFGIDTVTYALRVNLLPAVVDIFAIDVKDYGSIPINESTRWFSPEDLPTIGEALHPLAPEIVGRLIGSAQDELIRTEEEAMAASIERFAKQPSRALETAPEDEMPPVSKLVH